MAAQLPDRGGYPDTSRKEEEGAENPHSVTEAHPQFFVNNQLNLIVMLETVDGAAATIESEPCDEVPNTSS